MGTRSLSSAPDAGDGGLVLPTLPSDPIFTNLVVPGYPSAVVSLPDHAASPRPVVVVLHGSGDRPDWNCDAWRHITSARGFVLCPRGAVDPRESTPGDTRYTLGGPHLRDHVEAALMALAARFGPYVDERMPLLAGFSLGAFEISHLAVREPARFPRVALLEGGGAVWTDAAARAFASAGGLRVLFGCGSPWCVTQDEAAAARLRKANVGARIAHADVGHTNDRPLQEAPMKELAWFLAGDPRWTDAPSE